MREWAEAGFLEAIDGRMLPVRKPHAALNTLLQSAGAIACKVWCVLMHQRLIDAGLEWNWWHPERGDFAFAANIHDELQVQCRPEHEDLVRMFAIETAEQAGRVLGFRCALAGEAKVGSSWAETH